MESFRVDVVSETIPLLQFSPDGVMRHEFNAWLPDEIIALKLEGFVNEYTTKLLKISPNLVKVRIGKRSWLPLHRYEYDVPFNLVVKFDRTDETDASLVHVQAELKPLAWGVAKSIVNLRATAVMRALRSCLMAEGIDPEMTEFHYEA